MALESRGPSAAASGPHLVLARGVQEGRSFPLARRGEDEAWSIGRQRHQPVCLDYDPYISSEHARILSKEGKFFLMDLPNNKNGTLLNWQKMVRGGIAPLKSGDVIGVGMSLLVFREG